jgi:hypothetical protein
MPPDVLDGAAEQIIKAAVPEAPYVEIGGAGLRQQGGYIDEEFLRDLRGTKAAQVYREMGDNSPIIGGMLMAVEQTVRRIAFYAKPFSDESADIDNSDFVEECLKDMSTDWPNTLTEILTMVKFGWAYCEQVYKKRDGVGSRFNDGKIGWRKFALRAQETLWRWEFDEEGGIQGMWQFDPYSRKPPVLIPIEKALLFRTKTEKGNPEGRSALRNAYVPWFYSKRVMEIMGVGMERDLAGLPVMWVPPALLSETADAGLKALRGKLEKVVQNIRRDAQEGVLMPLSWNAKGEKDYDLTLLSTGGSRQFDVVAILELLHRLTTMTMLADFLVMGHESVGSFALSSDKTELFAMAIAGWVEAILEVINRHAIPRLFALNGLPQDRLPRIEHGDIETANLKDMAEYLKALSGAGVIMDEDLENYLRKQAGWPERPEGSGPYLMTPHPAVRPGSAPTLMPDGSQVPPPAPAPEPTPGGPGVAKPAAGKPEPKPEKLKKRLLRELAGVMDAARPEATELHIHQAAAAPPNVTVVAKAGDTKVIDRGIKRVEVIKIAAPAVTVQTPPHKLRRERRTILRDPKGTTTGILVEEEE